MKHKALSNRTLENEAGGASDLNARMFHVLGFMFHEWL